MKDNKSSGYIGNEKIRNRIRLLVLSFISAIACVIDFNVADVTVLALNNSNNLILQMFSEIYMSLKSTVLMSSVLTILIYYYSKIVYCRYEKSIYFCVMAFALSFLLLLGKSFSLSNGLSLVYSTPAQVCKSLLMVIGFYNLYLLVIKAIYNILNNGIGISSVVPTTILERLDKKKGFLIFLTLAWLPHLILKYPSGLCFDFNSQMNQFFGGEILTAHHPIFHTYLLGTIIKLLLNIVSSNVALFLTASMSMIFGILVFNNVYQILKKLRIPDLFRIIFVILVSITPYFAGYVGVQTKDILYNYSLVWFFSCYVQMVFGLHIKNIKFYIGFIISSLLVILFRNDGRYIIIPALIVIGIWNLVKNKARDRVCILKIISVLVLPIVMAYFINNALISSSGAKPGSVAEMLSIPFQQTARYVVKYGNEITEEEKNIINVVLDYERLDELYDPLISDPVKATYKEGSTEELKEYFKVWLEGLKRHPITYFEATWNVIYGLFCPNIENPQFYCGLLENSTAELSLQQIPVMQKLQKGLMRFYYLLTEVPLIGLASNIGIFVIMLLIITLFCIKDRHGAVGIITIPLLMSLFICLAAPAFFKHPRYSFPIIYNMPLLISAYYYQVRLKMVREE